MRCCKTKCCCWKGWLVDFDNSVRVQHVINLLTSSLSLAFSQSFTWQLRSCTHFIVFQTMIHVAWVFTFISLFADFLIPCKAGFQDWSHAALIIERVWSPATILTQYTDLCIATCGTSVQELIVQVADVSCSKKKYACQEKCVIPENIHAFPSGNSCWA